MDALPYYKWYWIDYRANRKVQRMSWQARGLYRELLDEFWAEGVIPNDTEALADVCGCDHDTFLVYWPQIQNSWEVTEHGLVNAKMESQRTEMDKVRAIKARAGSRGGQVSNSATRIKQKQADAKHMLADAKHMQAEPDIAEQSRAEHEQRKTNTSRGKREGPTKTEIRGARHAEFKAEILKYWQSRNPDHEMPWDGAEGKQLEMWLRASPTTSVHQFTSYLRNRYKSEVNHSERPSRWIANVTNFAAGPLDKFNQPLGGGSNGTNHRVPESKWEAARRRILEEPEMDQGAPDDDGGAQRGPGALAGSPGGSGDGPEWLF